MMIVMNVEATQPECNAMSIKTLITGGLTRIGATHAGRLARRGHDLVLDMCEAITIPALSDAALWHTYQTARQAMLPDFANTQAAARYRG